MQTFLALAFVASFLAPQDPKPAPEAAPKSAEAKVAPPEARLDASPRHHEWIDVASGAEKVHCFVAFPEVKEKAPVVLVLHENKGLTTWVRAIADDLAAAGYVAVAPDLLSGKGPNGGNTESFPSVDAATKGIYALDPAQVTANLNAVCEHAKKLDASNGKLAVAGFCWGGSQTFEFASRRTDLAAALVFYGGAPKEKDAFARIACPVYGFYGENDNRITAGVEPTKDVMKSAGKTFEPVIYAGAGHGFFRAGESAEPGDANRKARDEAWTRVKAILSASFAAKPK